MSAPGTPKASEAAVAAVQDALGKHFGYDIEADEREALARALTDAVAPHIAAQTLRDAAIAWTEQSKKAKVFGAVGLRVASDLATARADQIEAGQ